MPVLKGRRWATTHWQLFRTGPGAGKYTYTVRVRTVQKSGKYNKWKNKLITKSLKEAREYYYKNSYSKRSASAV